MIELLPAAAPAGAAKPQSDKRVDAASPSSDGDRPSAEEADAFEVVMSATAAPDRTVENGLRTAVDPDVAVLPEAPSIGPPGQDSPRAPEPNAAGADEIKPAPDPVLAKTPPDAVLAETATAPASSSDARPAAPATVADADVGATLRSIQPAQLVVPERSGAATAPESPDAGSERGASLAQGEPQPIDRPQEAPAPRVGVTTQETATNPSAGAVARSAANVDKGGSPAHSYGAFETATDADSASPSPAASTRKAGAEPFAPPIGPQSSIRAASATEPAAPGRAERLTSEIAAPFADVPEVRAQATPARIERASLVSADAPPAVVRVEAALRRLDGGEIEIRLDPPELGRVRVSLAPTDSGLVAIVAAERPEAADLLRRHSEALLRSLSEAGHEEVSLQFQSEGRQHSHRGEPESSEPTPTGRGPSSAAADPQRLAPIAAGLDLRV